MFLSHNRYLSKSTGEGGHAKVVVNAVCFTYILADGLTLMAWPCQIPTNLDILLNALSQGYEKGKETYGLGFHTFLCNANSSLILV